MTVATSTYSGFKPEYNDILDKGCAIFTSTVQENHPAFVPEEQYIKTSKTMLSYLIPLLNQEVITAAQKLSVHIQQWKAGQQKTHPNAERVIKAFFCQKSEFWENKTPGAREVVLDSQINKAFLELNTLYNSVLKEFDSNYTPEQYMDTHAFFPLGVYERVLPKNQNVLRSDLKKKVENVFNSIIAAEKEIIVSAVRAHFHCVIDEKPRYIKIEQEDVDNHMHHLIDVFAASILNKIENAYNNQYLIVEFPPEIRKKIEEQQKKLFPKI